MKINRDNYEAYFLDYHEGHLNPQMEKELLLFVEMNPDLKYAFDEFESICIDSDQDIVFENKSFLKKNMILATSQINDSNYEEFLVGETEGLLNTEQLAMLEEFLTLNPQFEKDRRIFALTHLQADNSVIFEAKEALKQKAIPIGSIDGETFETYMARELEGDLDSDEKLQLAEFLKYNPHLSSDHRLYKHTILVPDNTIVFAGKEQLKHLVLPIRRLILYTLSAAASLALIMSVYLLLDRHDIPQSIAETGKIENKVKQQIESPATVFTDKQIASNNKLTPIRSTNSKENSKVITQQENAGMPEKENSQIAISQRHFIEPLQAKDANKIKTRNFVDPQFTFVRVSQMYSNQHLEFYYNLKLAEDIQYAQLNSKDANPIKTVLKAANDRTGNLFASKHNKPGREENKSFSMWTLAELGVQTINNVTSSELELKLKKDDEGKVVGYDLESGLFNIEKDLKK